jgi:hypothetical protein
MWLMVRRKRCEADQIPYAPGNNRPAFHTVPHSCCSAMAANADAGSSALTAYVANG